MRAAGWVLVPTTLGLLLALGTACRPQSFPGTSAGSFAVTETLGTNECAGGFDPDAMLSYTVDVRVQGSVAYWHRDGIGLASGTYANGHFHFVDQQDIQAYGADAGPGGPPGCVLRQTETIDGDLMLGARDGGEDDDAAPTDVEDAGADAGVRSSGFAATDVIQLSIAPGSDCSAIFATNGGPFTTLPCSVHYDVSATSR